jgi:hypothetical protein
MASCGRLIAGKYTMNLLSDLKFNDTKVNGEVTTADYGIMLRRLVFK